MIMLTKGDCVVSVFKVRTCWACSTVVIKSGGKETIIEPPGGGFVDVDKL